MCSWRRLSFWDSGSGIALKTFLRPSVRPRRHRSTLPILVDDQGSWNNADIGRTVNLQGTFTDDELLLANRELDGQAGVWVVTRFELIGGQTVAVVRGWLPDDASPSPLSRQSVNIQGVLHPDEEFYEGANATRVVTVDSAALADAWGEDVIDGYVMLGGDQGDAARGVPLLVPPTVQVGDVRFSAAELLLRRPMVGLRIICRGGLRPLAVSGCEEVGFRR